jgi:O-antigen/teichoic acid export membrane protein
MIPPQKDDHFSTDHLRSGLRMRAVRGAGATIFSNALSFFVQFLGTIILARLLTPVDFGLITMVTAFSLLLQNFGVNGFTEAIIQSEVIDHKMMSTLFWINAIISFILTLLFMTMAPLLAWFYKEPRLYLITIGISLSIIASGLSTLHMALLRRNMQFYISSGIEVTARVVSVSIPVFLAWQGWGYWSLVAGFVASPVTYTAGTWIFCRWRPGLPTSGTGIGPMLKFALNTYGTFSLNYFSRNIDKLLIGWRYASQSLGYYKKAFDLFALPAGQLTAPLTSVALATLSRLNNDPEKYRRYYLEAVSMIAFIGMPLSAILTLTGNDVIILILGPQWQKAGEIFCFFGAGMGIMLIYSTQGWLHLSLGRPDRWLRWGVLECILTTVSFVIGLSFGASGVAIAYTASFYVLAGPCLLYAGRPINLKLSSLISATWKYFASALTAGLVSFFLLYSFQSISQIFIPLNILLRLIVSSVICLSIYLLLIIVLYRGFKPISQFFSLLRDMIPYSLAKKSTLSAT